MISNDYTEIKDSWDRISDFLESENVIDISTLKSHGDMIKDIICCLEIAIDEMPEQLKFAYRNSRTIYLYIVMPCLVRDLFRELMICYLIKKYKDPSLKITLNHKKTCWMPPHLNINPNLIRGIIQTQNILSTSLKDLCEALEFYTDEDEPMHRNLLAHNPLKLYASLPTDYLDAHTRHFKNILLFFEEFIKVIESLQSPIK